MLSAEGAILLAALACAAMLGLPGRTINAAFINDVLVFIDGAHRITFGQVPNRDFHTALGPLVFYLPAAGYQLTGNFGAAIPVGMAIVVVAFIPAMIRKFHEAAQRGEEAVTLWGDGTPTREFLYVDDAAEGILLLGGRVVDAVLEYLR